MGLRIYTIHVPTSSLREAMLKALPQLVKEGFSWPAFFLGILWALWHRLWIEAAALIALFLALGVIFDFVEVGETVELAVLLTIAALVGMAGNDWRRESLRRRGFLEAGVVGGTNSETALARYLDLRHAAAGAVQPQRRKTVAPPPSGVMQRATDRQLMVDSDERPTGGAPGTGFGG